MTDKERKHLMSKEEVAVRDAAKLLRKEMLKHLEREGFTISADELRCEYDKETDKYKLTYDLNGRKKSLMVRQDTTEIWRMNDLSIFKTQKTENRKVFKHFYSCIRKYLKEAGRYEPKVCNEIGR